MLSWPWNRGLCSLPHGIFFVCLVLVGFFFPLVLMGGGPALLLELRGSLH